MKAIAVTDKAAGTAGMPFLIIGVLVLVVSLKTRTQPGGSLPEWGTPA